MKYPPPPAGEDEEEKPGDMYEGSMVAGKREGQGKYTWSNGAVYEGTYVDNKKQGKGKLMLPDKSVFDGTSSMGRMHYVHGEAVDMQRQCSNISVWNDA